MLQSVLQVQSGHTTHAASRPLWSDLKLVFPELSIVAIRWTGPVNHVAMQNAFTSENCGARAPDGPCQMWKHSTSLRDLLVGLRLILVQSYRGVRCFPVDFSLWSTLNGFR